jgi:hypothetical protein
MTGTDERYQQSRFGAAAPGARPERPSLEDLLTAPDKPAGSRRWKIVLGAVLVAVLAGGGGYLGGRFTAPSQPKLVRLLVTDTTVPAGAKLTRADLQVVTVQPGVKAPSGSLGPASERRLVGLAPRVAVPTGTFVTHSLLTAARAVPRGSEALVGLALRAGQLPAAGLESGERVLVVIVPSSASSGSFALDRTTVWDVRGSASSGATLATVMVPATIATQLAGYAARGEVALVATGWTRATPSTSTSPTTNSSPTTSTKPKH